MSFIKKDEDVCGLKTVYTPQGLRGPKGDLGTGLIDYTIVHPRTFDNQNEIPGISVIAPALTGSLKGATDPFSIEIDRMGFLEGVQVYIETPPAAAVGLFVFGDGFNAISYPTAQDYTGGNSNPSINTGTSSSFTNKSCFAWESLPPGQHVVVLRFTVPSPTIVIPDKLINVHLVIS